MKYHFLNSFIIAEVSAREVDMIDVAFIILVGPYPKFCLGSR